MTNETFAFTRALPLPGEFDEAFDVDSFVALPDDWLVAVTDVTASREAISAGRYKAVNMAGVAMISAVMNALGGQDIPYIFGGDGAAVALAPSEREAVARVLAACVTFVEEDLDLALRAALVPVARLRADGFDVRVRRLRLSDALDNYAFLGGGLSEAEKRMKAGLLAVAKAPPGTRPDLTGLSCRWTPIREAGRSIVSLIVEPAPGLSAERFASIERRLLALAGGEGGRLSPMPPSGPGVEWPPVGLELEARATRGRLALPVRRVVLHLSSLLAWFLFRTGTPFGSFDPNRYRRYTSLNTDFRKVQDGLRMTLSLDRAALDRLRALLDEEQSNGAVRFGLCVQDSAVLTCYVPSLSSDAHYHFLDGAGGGYAGAASDLAARAAA
ncbi:MAG: hypothetical protein BroJett030_11560 [Alphaproteobacteria bacterium]|nr:MAG: hypothetical protein BroJett030_11560 [Alphaproteobacteria bacterium]